MATQPRDSQQKIKFANDLNAVHTPRQGLASRGGMNSMRFGKTAFVLPMLCLLAACGTATASNNDANSNTVAPVTTNGTEVAAVSDPTAFKLGTNLTTIQWWDGSRPFM